MHCPASLCAARHALLSADPVDVGAQSDLFGATAPAVARPSIAEQNGGSRVLPPRTYGDQAHGVTFRVWRCPPDRRRSGEVPLPTGKAAHQGVRDAGGPGARPAGKNPWMFSPRRFHEFLTEVEHAIIHTAAAFVALQRNRRPGQLHGLRRHARLGKPACSRPVQHDRTAAGPAPTRPGRRRAAALARRRTRSRVRTGRGPQPGDLHPGRSTPPGTPMVCTRPHPPRLRPRHRGHPHRMALPRLTSTTTTPI